MATTALWDQGAVAGFVRESGEEVFSSKTFRAAGPGPFQCERGPWVGFVQTGNESLAETMARALGIDTDELRACIAENRIGTALLERFMEPENTTDIAT